MIGKVSWLSTEPGERGRSHSISPTSNASANSKRLGEVNGFVALTRYYLPPPAPSTASIDHLGTALDNLALAAGNDTTVFQQLTAANLVLTMSNATLTVANKKLSEALAKVPAPTTPGTPRPPWPVNKPFPGNYCWTQGHRVSQNHTSAMCGSKAVGHKDVVTTSNTMGGSNANKGWNTRRT